MSDLNSVENFLQHPKIVNLGIKKESLIALLKLYNDITLRKLLENGRIEIGNGMILEVVQLLDRVHVLRGTPYSSNHKYKLKLTMEESIYKTIENYYNKLEEEIS